MENIKTELRLEYTKFLSCSSVVNNLITILSVAGLGKQGLLFSLRWIVLTILVYLSVEDSYTRHVSFYMWIPLLLVTILSIIVNSQILHQTTGSYSIKGLFVAILLCMIIPLSVFALNIVLIMITGKNQIGFADIMLLVPITLFNGLGHIQTGNVEAFLTASLIIFAFVTATANLLQCIIQFIIYSILVYIHKTSTVTITDLETPEQDYKKQLGEKLLRMPLVVSLTVGTFASYLLGITL